jgi:hypothetical protein
MCDGLVPGWVRSEIVKCIGSMDKLRGRPTLLLLAVQGVQQRSKGYNRQQHRREAQKDAVPM